MRQDLRKAASDDGGHLFHEVGDFLPFVWQQILLELRMNRPLRLDLRALPAYQDAEQLDIP